MSLDLPHSKNLISRQSNNDSLMQDFCPAANIGQQIAHLIFRSQDSETALIEVTSALGSIFQGDASWIATSIDGYSSRPPSFFWMNDDVLSKSPVNWLEKLSQAKPLKVSRLVAIEDIQADKTGLAKEAQAVTLRALLKISTQFQGQPNGMIFIGKTQPYAWSDSEKELLEVVSETVAIAVAQFQLHQQLHRANQHQMLIDELTMATHSTSDLQAIFQLAIAGTGQVLQADRGMLLLLKYSEPLRKAHLNTIPKAKVTVACQWSREILTSIENDYSFCLSNCGWCEQAFAHAPHPLAVSDRTNDSSVNKVSECFLSPEVMPALLIVPLMGGTSDASRQKTILGFLVFQQTQPRLWQSEELNFVNWVSAQTSIAIIQSRTLRQVQALVEERTQQLKTSLDVQAKLYEKSRQQINQLRHLNELKDDFLSAVSHELRTPLTSMALAIRMLRQPELSSERRAKYLDILEQQCSQEINLVDDLLRLQEIESKSIPTHIEKIDIKEFVYNLTESFEQKWADKSLSIEVDLPERSLTIQSDKDSLSRILLELLTNAGKYSEPETTVHLSVIQKISQKAPQVIFTISNIGPGIPPDEQTHIFDKFHRGEGVTQQAIPGTGLGLALVKCLVEHLNGTIEVKSYPNQDINEANSFLKGCETEFILTLPCVF